MIHATVFGNVGGEPKLATTQGGKETLKFNVASNSGKGEDKTTTWTRITVWGKQATTLAPLVANGKRVIVIGRASLREWQGNNGKMTDLEIDADDVRIVDYPEDGQRPAPQAAASRPAAPAAAAGPALPPGVPAGSALHHAVAGGPPTHFCRPGGAAWEPIPAPPSAAPALPPPPAAAPHRAQAPF